MKLLPGHVLLVEYSTDMAAIFEAILKREGLIVTIARTDQRGLELARQQNFNLVVVDWHMQGDSEDCKFHWLKLGRPVPHVPVIFLSSHTQHQHSTQAMRLGASGFFIKPFNVAHLVDRIKEVITSHRPKPADPQKKPGGK